jgi:hypothetical protein
MREQQAIDARDAVESKRAEQERERRAEEYQAQTTEFYRQQAELRGEEISALDVATGRVSGRSLAEIFEDARQAGDREDVLAAARLSRAGGSGPLHLMAGDEPLIHASSRTRGPVGRALDNRRRRFDDRRAAERAAAAAQASLNDVGFVCDAPPRRESEVDVIGPSHRGSDEQLRLSFR